MNKLPKNLRDHLRTVPPVTPEMTENVRRAVIEAQKPAPKKRKARVVAKNAVLGTDNIIFLSGPAVAAQSPVFVLPADPESVARMVEQVANALCCADGLEWDKQADPMTSGSGGDDQSGYRELARAALAGIGIKGGKRK